MGVALVFLIGYNAIYKSQQGQLAAVKAKITAEQAKHEIESIDTSQSIRKPMINDRNARDARDPRDRQRPRDPRDMRDQRRPEGQPPQAVPAAPTSVDASPGEKNRFREMMEELIGTKGAYLLDSKLTILGKVPMSELATTIKSLNSGIYAVVLDGSIDTELASLAERANVRHLIGMDSNVHGGRTSMRVMTAADL